MVQLETVEDFENIKKALDNPNTYPRFYCICPYSYCFHCEEVKEFEAPMPFSLGEIVVVKCLGCAGFFTVDDFEAKNEIFWGFQFLNKSLYREFATQINEMKKMNSREIQIKFFAVELERRISLEKKKMREFKSSIERFARLRT